MTEERRATADGVPPPPEEFDDIPIDEATSQSDKPPPKPATPASVPPDRPSRGSVRPDMSPSARRVRARMTLRIPDDEVSRPTPVAAPVAPVESNGEIQATRIITIEPDPPDSDHAGAARVDHIPPSRLPSVGPSRPELAAAAAALPPRQQTIVEDSWTPYAPTTADGPPPARSSGQIVPPAVPSDAASTGEYPPQPPSEEIPIALEVASDGLEIDVAISTAPSTMPPPMAPGHHPGSPPAASPPIAPMAPRAPMRAVLPTDPDGEDVRFDEEDAAAAHSHATRSDTGELAEIAAEDLVSVESAPTVVPSSPALPQAALPQMRPRAKSIPSIVPSKSAYTAPANVSVTPPPAAPPPSQTTVAAPVAPSAFNGAWTAPRVMVPSSAPSPLAPPAMTEAAAARKRTRPWWEELFNDDYIRTMAKITDGQIAAEATFIEESLGVAQGAMVLDLACGTGRHAIELTRRGYKVVGFDLSLSMLARAADEAYDRSQKLNFVQGDMREMTFENSFDGVYCWNTSFGFFEEEKNAQVVQRVHKSLRPGGQFLLDVVNRDFIIRQQPSLAWFEGDGCICMDEMQIDWITSRMRTKRTMMMDDGRTKEIEYSIRLYALHELGKLLHDNGFKVVEVSGRAATPGVFFGNESPRTLILAEKR